MPNPKLRELCDKALSLPLDPGVYIMYDRSDTVIYVGKAKALKNRVCQYFRPGTDHAPKVAKMVDHVDHFEYIICAGEFEALVLEASLIKQYQPKYNILLKDGKGYHYIKITPPPYRRISAVKQIENDGSRYLGPYYSAFVVEQSVDQACKIFGLPACHKQFPKDLRRGRPCLNHAIGNCCGLCSGKVSAAAYEERVDQAIQLLTGGAGKVCKSLQKQMEQAAENLQFERAAQLRDRMRALQKMSDKQVVVAGDVEHQDVIAYARTTEQGCFEVFHVSDGALRDREHYFVDAEPDDGQTRLDFLLTYYSEREIPPRITLDVLPENLPELKRWLSERRGKSVTVHVPQRGEQHKILSMCLSNAQERLLNTMGHKSREQSVLAELAALLSLDNPPHRIESYDISHTAGDENVASMVVYCDGRRNQREYRHFKIRSFQGQNDYGSMQEVLTRRMEEYLAQKETGKGFGALPDLILLDGGKGQLSAVQPVLEKFGVNIPLFGMVKDSHHHTRAIVGLEGEIRIKANRNVFTFVSDIQDETHRFAITYHRKRTSSKMTRSSLLDIPGVGPKRAAVLLKAMGSIKNIAAADLEQLAAVKGMDRTSSLSVYRYFHPDKEQSK